MMAELVSALGFIGLALTVVGLYGFLAFRVNQRRREIGIRMALGASRETTALLILRDTARMAAIGLALGLLLAIGATRVETSCSSGYAARSTLTLRRDRRTQHRNHTRSMAPRSPRRFR